MVNYGNGEEGDVVKSANETFTSDLFSFQNLTVDAGVTLTFPHRTVILVSQTLDCNGVIEAEKRDLTVSGGSGDTASGAGGDGGKPGGSLTVIAREITGSGNIRANGGVGGDGEDETTDDFDGTSQGGANGTDGQGAEIIHEQSKVSTNPTIATGGDGAGGDTLGTEDVAGDGAAGGLSMRREMLDLFIENRLVSGSYISQFPIQEVLSSTGAGGGSGAADGAADQTGGGGGGGGGGGLGGGGGAGGDGADGLTSATTPTTSEGSGAGGGGGAGGFMIVASEDVGTNVTFETQGGDGGAGGSSQGTGSDGGGGGGGGGGGSGGILIAFTDKEVTTDLSGGAGGAAGSSGSGNAAQSGEDGNDGVGLRFEVSDIA